MKKIISAAMMLCVGALGYSQFALDFWGEMASPFEEPVSLGAVSRALDQEDLRMGGFGFMTVINKTGYGTRSLLRFQQEPVKGWTADFQTTFGLSHHLFGAGSKIGIYGEAGLGAAGKADLIRGSRKEEASLKDLQMSLFPYLAVGATVALDHILLGARADFHTINLKVPGAPLDTYPLSKFQFGIYAGFTTGRIEWNEVPLVKELSQPRHRVRIRVEQEVTGENSPVYEHLPNPASVPETAADPATPEEETVSPPSLQNDRDRARDLVRDAWEEDF